MEFFAQIMKNFSQNIHENNINTAYKEISAKYS